MLKNFKSYSTVLGSLTICLTLATYTQPQGIKVPPLFIFYTVVRKNRDLNPSIK